MEKVIYLVWRDASTSIEALGAGLTDMLVPELRAMGAVHLKLNVADAAVKPAVGLKQLCLKPQPEALVQVWLHSAIDGFRAKADQLVGRACHRYAAYLVTESQPIVNLRHPAKAGERTFGFAQIALLRKPARLAYKDWLDVWHNSHTQVAIETQSTFEYIQNVVIRPLTPDAPAIDAIVEECFPPEAMTDFKAFFDAPGDQAKFKLNFNRMIQSVARFIEPGQIDVIPTSQYPQF